MSAKLYLLHALSPVHAGTGQGEGVIDLPIARERATQHPIIPGSSVKGVLRDHFRRSEHDSDVVRLFGPETANASVHAGALRFSDARTLLLPVTSDEGTFAWVTCPWILANLKRDAPADVELPDAIPKVQAGEGAVSGASALHTKNSNIAVLAGMNVSCSASADKWAKHIAKLVFDDDYWIDFCVARLIVVHDDTFTWLSQNATDVRARICIDPDTGTVKQGQLWYEESLPAETVLFGVVNAASVNGFRAAEAIKGLEHADGELIQIGGKATVGLGRTRIAFHGGEA